MGHDAVAADDPDRERVVLAVVALDLDLRQVALAQEARDRLDEGDVGVAVVRHPTLDPARPRSRTAGPSYAVNGAGREGEGRRPSPSPRPRWRTPARSEPADRAPGAPAASVPDGTPRGAVVGRAARLVGPAEQRRRTPGAGLLHRPGRGSPRCRAVDHARPRPGCGRLRPRPAASPARASSAAARRPGERRHRARDVPADPTPSSDRGGSRTGSRASSAGPPPGPIGRRPRRTRSPRPTIRSRSPDDAGASGLLRLGLLLRARLLLRLRLQT